MFTGDCAKRLSEVYDGMEISKEFAKELGIEAATDTVTADVFTILYEKYESEGKASQVIQANDVATGRTGGADRNGELRRGKTAGGGPRRGVVLRESPRRYCLYPTEVRH